MVKKRPSSKAAAGAAPGKNVGAASGGPQAVADPQVDRIRRVIDVMVGAGAVEVELQDADGKLRIRLKEDPTRAACAAPPMVAAAPTPTGAAAVAAPTAAPVPGKQLKSPMVGTFYRSPSPEAEPFVKVGDHVGLDTVVCIIEAMKVMNEIKAELEGQVLEILAQNGEAVDYGQPLFILKG